jgi:GNAT superfamily N-acetyltransferase
LAGPDIVVVTPETVEQTGFFCKMSARGTPGYERKKAWLDARFAEGLQMRLLGGGERGFIEFIPGDYAWRAIEGAADYLVIHCLWVVGRSKGKGLSSALIHEASEYAKANGYKGLTAVTSRGNWLVDAGILSHHGFAKIASAPPSFDLMVLKFDPSAPDPRFCGGWEEKLAAMGPGLVVQRTGQCPYLDDAAAHARGYAEDVGLPFSDIVFSSAEELRQRSPTPYGVFALALDGRLIAYHYLLKKQIAAWVEKQTAGA